MQRDVLMGKGPQDHGHVVDDTFHREDVGNRSAGMAKDDVAKHECLASF